MATAIIMPKVDMVMEAGTFLEWLKAEGDPVQQGEPLFVIGTDKADIEIESPASGLLQNLTAKPKATIPISQVIGYIVQPGEVAPVEQAGAQLLVTTAPPVQSRNQPLSQNGPSVEKLIRATPLARSLARERGLNLAEVTGGGPQGRIHKADIERHLDSLAAKASPAPAPAIPGQTIADASLRERRRELFTGARAIIAQRMVQSVSTIPHIHLTVQVDMSEVARLRSMVNPTLTENRGVKVSYTAIIARAVAALLPQHPYLNSSLVGEELVLWEDVNLGIATNQADHLIVPVIHRAHELRLDQIAHELDRLLALARTRKLPPFELRGGTFTISNLGMMGISSFTAIINPPEAAILAVGQIEERPVARHGEVVIRPIASFTLAADHRIVDGAAVASFLSALKTVLENPYLLV